MIPLQFFGTSLGGGGRIAGGAFTTASAGLAFASAKAASRSFASRASLLAFVRSLRSREVRGTLGVLAPVPALPLAGDGAAGDDAAGEGAAKRGLLGWAGVEGFELNI